MLGATRLLTRLPSRSSAVANIFARQSRLSSSAIPRQPTLPLITYDVASPRVKMVFDDMIKTFELKGPHQINDFWKVLANHEDSFESLWNRMKVVMAEGEISAKVKEMIYVGRKCLPQYSCLTACITDRGINKQFLRLLRFVARILALGSRISVNMIAPLF